MEPQAVEAINKAVWWLGETKGFWVQTGALSLSAMGALWIVLSRARSERRRATVDLVLHQLSDADFQEAMKIFWKIYKDGNLGRFVSQTDAPEYIAIIKILNAYEFTAGGIREKAYDERIYKRMRCSTTIKIWDSLSGFVQDFRNLKQKEPGVDTRTFYQDLEWIAGKWKKSPLKSR